MARGPERAETLAEHLSIGAIAVIVLGARIAWRIGQRGPSPPDQAPALNLLSQVVQWGLLAAIGALILTGPALQWSVGRGVDVFGLVSIPSPMPEMRWLHGALEEIHEFASHALILLLALHVLGALKHLIIDRDDVFRRMLWVRQEAGAALARTRDRLTAIQGGIRGSRRMQGPMCSATIQRRTR